MTERPLASGTGAQLVPFPSEAGCLPAQCCVRGAGSGTSCYPKVGLWRYTLFLCAATAKKMLAGESGSSEPGTERGRDFTPAIPGLTKSSGITQP